MVHSGQLTIGKVLQIQENLPAKSILFLVGLTNYKMPWIATGLSTLFNPLFLKTFNTIFYNKFPVGKRLPVFKWDLIRTQYSFYRNPLISNMTELH